MIFFELTFSRAEKLEKAKASTRRGIFRTGELRFHGVRAEIMVTKTGEEKKKVGHSHK